MTDLGPPTPKVAVAGAGSRRTPPTGAVAALVGGGPVGGEAIAVEAGARSIAATDASRPIAATGRRSREVV